MYHQELQRKKIMRQEKIFVFLKKKKIKKQEIRSIYYPKIEDLANNYGQLQKLGKQKVSQLFKLKTACINYSLSMKGK